MTQPTQAQPGQAQPSSARHLRLVFAGTPETAVPSLRALAASGHDLLGVLTRTDAPLGRKRRLTPSPVATAAAELGLPIVKANRLDQEATERILGWRPDLGVVVAYGGLLREPLLSTPRHGWINLHFSALPRWRGAAPVQRAILAGDAEIGIDVFRLVAELDAGDVLASRVRPLGADETAGQALDSLAVAGAGLLTDVVDRLAAGTAVAVPQHGESSYAHKLTLEDARVRWNEDAQAVYARIRAMTPEPGAFTMVHGRRLKLHQVRRADTETALPPGRLVAGELGVLAGTASTPLLLVTVQPEGKRAMPASEWWRGHGSAAMDAQ